MVDEGSDRVCRDEARLLSDAAAGHEDEKVRLEEAHRPALLQARGHHGQGRAMRKAAIARGPA